jgi:hypothetical protein
VLARVQLTFLLNQEASIARARAMPPRFFATIPISSTSTQLAGNLRLGLRRRSMRIAKRSSDRRSRRLGRDRHRSSISISVTSAAELNAQGTMKLNPDEAHLILAARPNRGDRQRARAARARIQTAPARTGLLMLARI